MRRTAVITGDGNMLCKLMAESFSGAGINTVMLVSGGQEQKGAGLSPNSGLSPDSVDSVYKKYGKVDYLVNCIIPDEAVGNGGAMTEITNDFWDNAKAIGIDSFLDISRLIISRMSDDGGGRILNICSITGLVPVKKYDALSAASASAIMITKSMAVELAQFGISANAIGLGAMDEGSGVITLPRDEKLLMHVPKGRTCSVDEFLKLVLFAMIEAPDYLTGNVFILDGGWSCSYLRDW